MAAELQSEKTVQEFNTCYAGLDYDGFLVKKIIARFIKLLKNPYRLHLITKGPDSHEKNENDDESKYEFSGKLKEIPFKIYLKDNALYYETKKPDDSNIVEEIPDSGLGILDKAIVKKIKDYLEKPEYETLTQDNHEKLNQFIISQTIEKFGKTKKVSVKDFIELLLDKNSALIEQLTQILLQDNRLIIGLFTSRTNYILDLINSIKNGTLPAFVIFPLFVKGLKARLKNQFPEKNLDELISFHPGLISDAVYDLTPGDSYLYTVRRTAKVLNLNYTENSTLEEICEKILEPLLNNLTTDSINQLVKDAENDGKAGVEPDNIHNPSPNLKKAIPTELIPSDAEVEKLRFQKTPGETALSRRDATQEKNSGENKDKKTIYLEQLARKGSQENTISGLSQEKFMEAAANSKNNKENKISLIIATYWNLKKIDLKIKEAVFYDDDINILKETLRQLNTRKNDPAPIKTFPIKLVRCANNEFKEVAINADNQIIPVKYIFSLSPPEEKNMQPYTIYMVPEGDYLKIYYRPADAKQDKIIATELLNLKNQGDMDYIKNQLKEKNTLGLYDIKNKDLMAEIIGSLSEIKEKLTGVVLPKVTEIPLNDLSSFFSGNVKGSGKPKKPEKPPNPLMKAIQNLH